MSLSSDDAFIDVCVMHPYLIIDNNLVSSMNSKKNFKICLIKPQDQFSNLPQAISDETVFNTVHMSADSPIRFLSCWSICPHSLWKR